VIVIVTGPESAQGYLQQGKKCHKYTTNPTLSSKKYQKLNIAFGNVKIKLQTVILNAYRINVFSCRQNPIALDR
jgi:hypothetical protein